MKESFGLYLILTDPAAGYEACAAAAVQCGVRYLQLRMKGAPQPLVLETACRMRSITRGTATRFIVNDNLSVAMEADADGLHLGQADLSLSEARKAWNTPGKIIGLSTHNAMQVERARDQSPDYIGVGPIFTTPTKPDAAPALGIQSAAQLIRRSPLTAVAIGGIDSENLPELLGAGIENFCVVRAVNDAADPLAAIRHLQAIWKDRPIKT